MNVNVQAVQQRAQALTKQKWDQHDPILFPQSAVNFHRTFYFY